MARGSRGARSAERCGIKPAKRQRLSLFHKRIRKMQKVLLQTKTVSVSVYCAANRCLWHTLEQACWLRKPEEVETRPVKQLPLCGGQCGIRDAGILYRVGH